MVRKCKCAGGCCGSRTNDITRRKFLSWLGVGAAATATLSGPAWAEWLQKQVPPEELERWKRALTRLSPPTVYRSGVHADARLPLGGIGTGNIEIGADGRLTRWQLFNTLKDGELPFWFAVRAGGVTKLLQTAGGPDAPHVRRIEMVGEYPIAALCYDDAELPVKIEMTAFTPFAPLDSRFSSWPLAAMAFRIQNPTSAPQTVSLAAVMQNPVGYDACEPLDGLGAECLGGNVNEPFHDGKIAGLSMRAEAGRAATVERGVSVYFGTKLQPLRDAPWDRPKNFQLSLIECDAFESIQPADPAGSVVWFEEPSEAISAKSLAAAKKAVEAGAVLVFSGKVSPLLSRFAESWGQSPRKSGEKRPDVVFEDFEHGYEKWAVEGSAFGVRPAAGSLPSQHPVTGFHGRGLANSYNGGDLPVGRLVSKPFAIERDFIRLLVGGGNQPGAQVRLVVDGKTVRTVSGRNSEELASHFWNVREFAGRQARIEIVDEEKGGWGHIIVDDIVFSDRAGEDIASPLLEEMLPIRFSGVREAGNGDAGPNVVTFENFELQPNAEQATLRGGLKIFSRPLGRGRVVVAAGAILDPGKIGSPKARQQAYTTLCELAGVRCTPAEGVPSSACGFGTMALAAVAEDVTVLPGVGKASDAWTLFRSTGRFAPTNEAKPTLPTATGQAVYGGVAATVEVPPGGSVEVPFLLTWHYPNKYNSSGVWMGCRYATFWPDAQAVVRDAAANFPALRRRTEAFRKTFYDSTLPYWLLDCITSQAATIRHIGIVFRIADGDIYGWEGSNGCCQPTCTHVWGYEQSLARLFPDLEKIMRQIDFKRQQDADGGVHNRTDVPAPSHPTGEFPFADGHASCILKAYREALNHPDDSFFREYWPNVKRAVEYLIGRDAGKNGSPDGVLEDDQYNTYDQPLHGATTFISGYYLAALRAGEAWARRMGDTATAERFHAIFLKGQENLVRRCWNGEYFQQDLPDYEQRSQAGPGEVGPGCMADQLIGQWWAHQLGLGYILPKDKVQAALRSIFQYNWVPDLTGFKQEPRLFAGDGDKGLLIVTWPRGGRPGHVMLYSDEIWTGIEYQVAAHMIYEGMVEEGLAVARGARDRYDGIPRKPIERNPWNEIECGGHYARAMSSWSLLLALSGYEYDGTNRILRFTPRITPDDFKSFFTGPEGWGSLRQVREGNARQSEIHVVEGRLPVARLQLDAPKGATRAAVTLGGEAIDATSRFEAGFAEISLAAPVVIRAGETLTVVFS